jgi:hypothetical protein
MALRTITLNKKTPAQREGDAIVIREYLGNWKLSPDFFQNGQKIRVIG